MANNKTIDVKGTSVSIIDIGGQKYISLTDMLKAKDGDFLYLIGCEIEIQLSFWVFGKFFLIQILIMANSP